MAKKKKLKKRIKDLESELYEIRKAIYEEDKNELEFQKKLYKINSDFEKIDWKSVTNDLKMYNGFLNLIEKED